MKKRISVKMRKMQQKESNLGQNQRIEEIKIQIHVIVFSNKRKQ